VCVRRRARRRALPFPRTGGVPVTPRLAYARSVRRCQSVRAKALTRVVARAVNRTRYHAAVLALADHEVHVWFTRPERATPALAERYQALLSPDERDRHSRFYFDRDRHHYLVAHALVRTTLSQYADVDPAAWTFRNGPHGRPEIAGPDVRASLRFNLTHTDGMVAVAVARGVDVGVDVEGFRMRDTGIDIARRFFAPAETAHLERQAPEDRLRVFLEFWTLKEAFIKAIGKGLAAGLATFAMQLDEPPTVVFATASHGDPADWHFRRLHLANTHLAALAVRQPGAGPSIVVRETVPLDQTAIAIGTPANAD
jgi:4'-phosphopantetheinyl transferase